jgi:uncharacterized membrane protein
MREAFIPTFLSATRLSSLWDRLHASFWFLPAAMSTYAVVLFTIIVQGLSLRALVERVVK